MIPYIAPLKDMNFVMDTICLFKNINQYPAFAAVDEGLVAAILDEAARQARDVYGPLNRAADIQGPVLNDDHSVTTTPGYKEAYKLFIESGWNGLSCNPEYGGQGLPNLLSLVVMDMIGASSLSFSLLPLLNQGAIEALEHHGSDALKEKYLAKIITGEWATTMNLTEPQAGSDVGAVKTKAESLADGSYKIKGQKIFISYGEHDMTDNIIHLVLARLPDAPEGTRGISMFVVPKYFVGDDGALGTRNDLKCVSLEHKLGLHGSPTAVMSFGDNDNCIGYLLGEEGKGMSNMFTMMNHARIQVGVEGLSIAERAYQKAVDYAKDRVQGRAFGAEGAGPHTIVNHADVRRMLMTMRALTEAVRSIAYLNGAAIDWANHEEDEEKRADFQGLVDLLTPLTKAFGSEVACEVASLGIQVHGGMGFIEETGAAQYYRDARILPIYEGTNGIQAQDLVARKLMMNGGRHWRQYFKVMENFLPSLDDNAFSGIHDHLKEALMKTRSAGEKLVDMMESNRRGALAGSVPFLHMLSITLGGYLLAVQAVRAHKNLKQGSDDTKFMKNKIATARFYSRYILPRVFGLYDSALGGDSVVFAIDENDL
jgi:alkylation response protein AidB-like acyl-CoA dehydrogenase